MLQRVVALLLSLAGSRAQDASEFWSAFAKTAGLQELPAYAPKFRIEQLSLTMHGSTGPYSLPVYLLRDDAGASGSVVVATYTPTTSFLAQTGGAPMGEINLLAPTPDLAPSVLPGLPRYGWAWLWGAKMTTIPWLDCCSVTGDTAGFTVTAAADAASVLVSQWQTWRPNGTHAGRDAQSTHNFTLSWDARYGYKVDASLYLRINAAAAPQTVEFLNFLPAHHEQPWPAGLRTGSWDAPASGAPLPPSLGPWPQPTGSLTCWANSSAGESWIGFSENILGGAELSSYRMPASLGGTLLANAAGGYSAGIAFSAASGDGTALNASQSTCPTWGDQHQQVHFPPAPGADGFFVIRPSYSILWAPPAASRFALAHAADLHDAAVTPPPPPSPRWYTSNFLRLPREGFEAQPVPLTQPLRALAQLRYNPDYNVFHAPGIGHGSDSALAVAALPLASAVQPYAFSSSVPLVPLNASAAMSFSAWVRLTAAGGAAGARATAQLWLGFYEADDFNQNISTGPAYGRLAYMNSSVLSASGVGAHSGVSGTPALWTSPRVSGGAPVLARASGRIAPAGSDEGPSPAALRGDSGWVFLSIHVTTPPWVAYADLRVIAVADAGVNATALVDDLFFGPA